MKKIIGTFIVVLFLAFITIIVLRVWDIQIISIENVLRSTFTLVVLGIAIVLLIILYGFFFRNNEANYNSKSGKRAHPKL